MKILTRWFIAGLVVWYVDSRDPRSTQELSRCIQMAEPLIHDPSYIFPLSVSEIRNVCQMWDAFVDCIRKYTSAFLTRLQQEEFEKAINPSMESIHQLCIQDPRYEKAYLYYAPCMKKIAMEKGFCGGHYNLLARIAESPSETGPAICCSYHKFRSCVLKEAGRECETSNDPTRPIFGSDSTHFVSAMLNRALGFLLQKCANYDPANNDCLSYLASISHIDSNAYNKIVGNNAKANVTVPGDDPGWPKTGNSNTAPFPLNPWNSAAFRPTANRRPPPASSNFNPLVTIYPKPAFGHNQFTWTTSSPSSFFPTGSSFLENEIPKSEEFRGSGTAVLPMRFCMIFFSGVSIFFHKILYNCER